MQNKVTHTAHMLSPQVLLRAYACGIFPMGEEGPDGTDDIFWCRPPQRAILPIDQAHISRRLRRQIRHQIREKDYDVRFNYDVPQVIQACAKPDLAAPYQASSRQIKQAASRQTTWLCPTLIKAYIALWKAGYVHSVEIWQDEAFAGGLYGVSLAGAFFGESMVSLKPNGSKLALVHLLAELWAQGLTLLDIQMMTPHLQRFGSIEIEADHYDNRLADALKETTRFQPPSLAQIEQTQQNLLNYLDSRVS